MGGAPDLAIGRRFELLTRVGRGAFGEVYRAIDHRTGSTVAVKRLLEHRESPIILDRFEREARLLARLESPHVVGYVAHGPDDGGRACIALEWLEGEDLAQRQRARPLNVAESVEAVRQAALGLYTLHQAGIVHRDVKPANFYVVAAPEGDGAPFRIKLIDLGIARAHADDALTVEGARIGTPSYMSPEQARGELEVTPRSDLFSLGVVLYELLGGRRPFAGDEELVVLAKIVLHEPTPIGELCPDLAAELTGIVTRAMKKEPSERFADAFELAQALAAAPLPAHDTMRPAARGRRPSETPSLHLTSTSVSATREQRVVTALFAGFADAVDPEASMLRFAETAAAHGGVTHRTLGWRMIAIFGAVRSSGDEAVRAARAAEAAAASLPGVQLAIATGRALAGEGGLSADAIERGAGDLAGPTDGIRLDAPSARLVAARFHVETRGAVRLLGLERAALGSPGPRLLGRETPTVGRDRELAMLEASYEECRSEPIARAVLVTAPAGTGKSRLRHELMRRLERHAEPPTVLYARGDSLGAGSPFGMIAEAIRQSAGAAPGEPPAEIRDKLERRLARHLRPDVAPRVTEFLGELAGVSFEGRLDPSLRAARGDAILMGDAKRAAFEDWLDAESRAGPIAIVLEDLHWGDVPTVKLVDAALRRFADRPLFVLALARPEVSALFPDLWATRDLQEIRLAGLTRKACERIAREALRGIDDARIAFIVDRADGNPFFLEEMIRAVAEGERELPDTVLGVVQSRLDALGAELKQVLRAASVFGETFRAGGVACLCGGGEESTDRKAPAVSMGLEELARREVILVRGEPRAQGGTEYAFRHALLRDAAYAMLPEEDRTVGHRLAGAWLETSGETDAFVLAEHYDRGGAPDRALAWYRRAAEEALQGNDFAAAIARAERGVACGADGPELGALRLLQAEARRWSGEIEAAIEDARDALGVLPRRSVEWFRAAAELVVACGRKGDYDALATALGRALDQRAAEDAASAQVASLCPGVAQLLQAGRWEQAEAARTRIQALADGAAPLDPNAVARLEQLRAFSAIRQGDPEAALGAYTRALEAFARIGNSRNACIEQVNLAFAHAELGSYDEAEALLRSALGASERMGLSAVQGYASLNLGRVLVERGELDEAWSLELAALGVGRRERSPRIEGAARIHLSTIAFRAGDLDLSEQEARAAVETLTIAPPLQAGALASLARTLLGQGRAAEAREPALAAKRALSGSREMFDTLVRVTCAEMLQATGDRAAALAEIRAAEAHLVAAAGRLRDPALRTSFLSIADNARTLDLARRWCQP